MRRRPEKGTSGVARREGRGRGRAARADARVRGDDDAACRRAEARLGVVAGAARAAARKSAATFRGYPCQHFSRASCTRDTAVIRVRCGGLFCSTRRRFRKAPPRAATPSDASNARDVPSPRASLRLFALVSPSRSHLRARRAPRRGGISRGYPRETKKRSKRRFFRASEGRIPRPPPPRPAAPRVLRPRRAASLFPTLVSLPPPSPCPRRSPS